MAKLRGIRGRSLTRRRRGFRVWACVLLGAIVLSGMAGAWSRVRAAPASPIVLAEVFAQADGSEFERSVRQGQEFYQTGRFAEAIAILTNAIAANPTSDETLQPGEALQQVVVLSYLSLSYQQLGRLDLAHQSLDRAQRVLQNYQGDRSQVQYHAANAQLLNTWGSLYFKLGQVETALEKWQAATIAYANAGDEGRRLGTLINQAQAEQALGLFLRARDTLEAVGRSLQHQSDPAIQVAGFHSLGNILRLVGDLKGSYQQLQQGLTIAQQTNSPQLSLIWLSLGNTARSSNEPNLALEYYRQAAEQASPLVAVQARLNQLSLLVDSRQLGEAQTLADQIQPELATLSLSRASVYAHINYAQSLIRLASAAMPSSVIPDPVTPDPVTPDPVTPDPVIPELATPDLQSWITPAQILFTASEQAQRLGDDRAEAYALGHLGGIYERTKQWAIAQRLTERALLLAQAENRAPDIAYQWQWQLGRILKEQHRLAEATGAYQAAYEILQTLRSDLAAIDPSVQFSFRDRVEPVYRDYVDLLLQNITTDEEGQDRLKQARQVMESLQLAELTNFFRSACLEGQIVPLDEVDQTEAAVIYPIILPDRLEIILSLPGQPLQHYTTQIPQDRIESTVMRFRHTLEVAYPDPDSKVLGERLYSWLIHPLEPALAQNQVKVLVFVLDGVLRNVPVAALYTNNHYLIQDYAVAIAPGLQLLNPQPLRQQELQVLAAGLTEEREDFGALTNVARELEEIQAILPSQILLNQAFTSTALAEQINALPFPIVHLATHGQFSSNLDDTFILAWDKRISVEELSELLRTSDETRTKAIELLVLSACETASGDRRATLGLAGIAVQAGARSTLASLWSVDDASGAQLISKFYQALSTNTVSKAEALQQAQLSLLQDPDFKIPLYWASYVLIGNWL